MLTVQSDFYHVLLFYANGKPVPTIFATQDEALHRILRRPIAGMYSNSKVVMLESLVDTTMQDLIDRLDALFVEPMKRCDLGKWLQLFAFDVMGELTFSKPLGFLASGGDVDGITESIWRYFWKTSPVSHYRERATRATDAVADHTDTLGRLGMDEKSSLAIVDHHKGQPSRFFWVRKDRSAEN